MSRQIIREALMKANRQLNSNILACTPQAKPTLLQRYQRYRQTNKAIKVLHESYAGQKLNRKQNLKASLAMLYANVRDAHSSKDMVMMHRYLTQKLYEQWKAHNQHNKQYLQIYSLVTNIQLCEAKIVSSEHGEWFQCWIQMSNHDIESGSRITSDHIIERKLHLEKNIERSWYFCRFGNRF